MWPALVSCKHSLSCNGCCPNTLDWPLLPHTTIEISCDSYFLSSRAPWPPTPTPPAPTVEEDYRTKTVWVKVMLPYTTQGRCDVIIGRQPMGSIRTDPWGSTSKAGDTCVQTLWTSHLTSSLRLVKSPGSSMPDKIRVLLFHFNQQLMGPNHSTASAKYPQHEI